MADMDNAKMFTTYLTEYKYLNCLKLLELIYLALCEQHLIEYLKIQLQLHFVLEEILHEHNQAVHLRHYCIAF